MWVESLQDCWENYRRFKVIDAVAEDCMVIGRTGIALEVGYRRGVVKGYARADRAFRNMGLGLGEREGSTFHQDNKSDHRSIVEKPQVQLL